MNGPEYLEIDKRMNFLKGNLNILSTFSYLKMKTIVWKKFTRWSENDTFESDRASAQGQLHWRSSNAAGTKGWERFPDQDLMLS